MNPASTEFEIKKHGERFDVAQELRAIPANEWQLRSEDGPADHLRLCRIHAAAPGSAHDLGRGYEFEFQVDLVRGQMPGGIKLTAYSIADSNKPVPEAIKVFTEEQSRRLYDLVKEDIARAADARKERDPFDEAMLK